MLTMHRGSWFKLYVDALRAATVSGYTRPSREGETIEVGPAMLSCPSPVFGELEGRGGSAEFARVGQLELLAGVVPSPALLRLAPRYERWRAPDGTWPWVYGPRLVEQMPHIIWALTKRPFTRRATVTVWTPADASTHRAPDAPCALTLSFWVGPAGEVRLHSHQRSQDMWLGLYYDMPDFAFLQRAVAKVLRRPTGQHYHTAVSCHLYAKHVDKVIAVKPKAISGLRVHAQLPTIPDELSPEERWSYLVKWSHDQLAVA